MPQSVCIVVFDGPNQPAENTYLVTLFCYQAFLLNFNDIYVCQCFRGPSSCLSMKTTKYTSVFKILYCESVFENLFLSDLRFGLGERKKKKRNERDLMH